MNIHYVLTKKIHLTDKKLRNILLKVPKNYAKNIPMTPFPLAMEEQYKVHDDVVISYRIFYCYSKSRFANWKYCNSIPWWFFKKNFN